MTVIFHIPIQKANQEFLQDLQDKYAHTHADLEIKVHPKKSLDSQFEATFWQLIDLLDWTKRSDNEAIRPTIQKLASLPIRYCYTFQDTLSEKLFQLDGLKYAQHIGDDAYKGEQYPFSVDNFLYARCCVVANGKEAFEMVLNNPSEMPEDLTFEPLLSIAAKAYRLKTGKKYDYVPTYNYETFSNKKAWK